MNNFKILILIITRIIATLTMFWNPFIGLIIANIADALDVVLMSFLKIDKSFPNPRYQLFDKLSDNFILIIAIITVMIHPIIPPEYINFALFLFVMRILGSLIMLKTGIRRILLLTPNFILYYYGIFSYLYFINDYSILTNNHGLFNFIVVALFMFNYGQEITLHFLKLHPWEFIKSLYINKNVRV